MILDDVQKIRAVRTLVELSADIEFTFTRFIDAAKEEGLIGQAGCLGLSHQLGTAEIGQSSLENPNRRIPAAEGQCVPDGRQ